MINTYRQWYILLLYIPDKLENLFPIRASKRDYTSPCFRLRFPAPLQASKLDSALLSASTHARHSPPLFLSLYRTQTMSLRRTRHMISAQPSHYSPLGKRRLCLLSFLHHTTGSVGTSRFYFSQLFHHLLHAFCVEFVIVLAPILLRFTDFFLYLPNNTCDYIPDVFLYSRDISQAPVLCAPNNIRDAVFAILPFAIGSKPVDIVDAPFRVQPFASARFPVINFALGSVSIHAQNALHSGRR